MGTTSKFANFGLDADRKVLRYGGEIVPLPLKAVELLIELLRNRGQVVSKNELLDKIWPETFVEESVLSNNVYILRKTLAEFGGGKDLIQTVPRRGYRFAGEADPSTDDDEVIVDHHVFRKALIDDIISEIKTRSSVNVPTNGDSPDRTHLTTDNGRTAVGRVPGTDPIMSIAVLPLVNETGDTGLNYLSEGIAESIIDNLSLLPGLRVMARTSVFRLDAAAYSPQQIGAELDVESVVTGRIRQFEKGLSIKIELVRTADAAQLWGEQYRRMPDDILKVQTEIAREISGKLRLSLDQRDASNFPRREPSNSDAYHFYLKGRHFWNKRTAEWMKKGVESFRQALDCDPNYALAYSGLADSYISMATVGAIAPSVAIPKAKAALQKALDIDKRSPEALAAAGFISECYDWDQQAAEKYFDTAAEVNPNYSIGHHWRGFCLIARREFDRSIELMKRAQMLDPLSQIINTVCGLPFYYMRRYDRAINIYREVLETDSSFFPAYAYLAMAYEQNGQLAEARSAIDSALKLATGNTIATASLAYLQAISGDENSAHETIANLIHASVNRYVPAYAIAEVYAGLGDIERSLKALEKAVEERSWWTIFAGVNPRFECLHGEARFNRILDLIGAKT